jgi:general secretion pathway protein A
LLGAFVNEKAKITNSILKKAAGEVFGEDSNRGHFRKAAAWAPMVMVFIVFGAVLATSYYNNDKLDTLLNQKAVVISSEPVIAPLADDVSIHLPDVLSSGEGTVDTGKDVSYEALFDHWQISYNPAIDGPACSYAESRGLNCLRVTGTIEGLVRLNRPALIKLYDSKGKVYFAAITSITGQNATLREGSKTREILLKDIESQWAGSYTLLWKPPADYEELIRTGYQGHVVQWLDKQLSIIHDRELYGEGRLTFSDEFTAEIKRFQLAEGLKQDGIVGAKTIIHINTLNNENVPLLINKQKQQ